jgi:pimeloyl-ACP methyl ester carboxylesterase
MKTAHSALMLVVIAAVAVGLAPPAAAAAPCDSAPGGECGSVSVPLDRAQPLDTQIAIQYVRFPHRDASTPAAGTIFVTEGGPGFSALDNTQDQYLQLFGPLRATYDLVLIDQRGVGRSAAIDCEPLQKENTDLYSAAAACGQHLGTTSDLYGSGEVARDVEAVRAALGVDKFDFYGGSFAAMDIQAYAARFPSHLRSVVLDSPIVLSAEDPWFATEAKQSASTVKLICRRSAKCSSANPHPAADLSWLIGRLRKRPVAGTARDATGAKHHLIVTEARLARIVQSDAGGYVVQGEIAAASKALRGGDDAPLLRLAAENDFPLFHGDPSDPTLFSVGDNVARYCTDQTFQWDKQASVADRRGQFDSARAALPARMFAPFSVAAWVQPAPLGFLPDPCIGWPASTHHPEAPVPAGTVAGGVPALILTGDIDLSVPPVESAEARKQFPESTVVELAAAGHHTAFSARFDCATKVIDHFVADLAAGDTACAKKPRFVYSGVAAFPRRAGRSRAAVARVTTATILDALERTFLGADPSGVGLRGGSFTSKFADKGLTVKLRGARFAKDLPVSGKVFYRRYTELDAKVRVAGGKLRVSGVWASPGATRLEIRGTVRGRHIALSVPAT